MLVMAVWWNNQNIIHISVTLSFKSHLCFELRVEPAEFWKCDRRLVRLGQYIPKCTLHNVTFGRFLFCLHNYFHFESFVTWFGGTQMASQVEDHIINCRKITWGKKREMSRSIVLLKSRRKKKIRNENNHNGCKDIRSMRKIQCKKYSSDNHLQSNWCKLLFVAPKIVFSKKKL